mmetsp:Transcript_8010/g.19536  ORF Transcript_8010/g.19536 Transcript_8010/m.19536 type:complete len:241 (+) Transcript_8010:970-1692(+)
MSRSTTLMTELSLSISEIFWSISCCFSLYEKISLFTSDRTASRSAMALAHIWRSTASALSFAVVSFCRISISFCRMPIFSFISAAACWDVWIILTVLFRSFLTISYSFVNSLSCCARLSDRLERSRMMMSLTLISSSVSRRFETAFAYSRALLSRFVESSNPSRSSACACCPSIVSSCSSSLFSRRSAASDAALSFSSDSSLRKSLMKMSMSRFRSSSLFSCPFFSCCCDARRRLASSFW